MSFVKLVRVLHGEILGYRKLSGWDDWAGLLIQHINYLGIHFISSHYETEVSNLRLKHLAVQNWGQAILV